MYCLFPVDIFKTSFKKPKQFSSSSLSHKGKHLPELQLIIVRNVCVCRYGWCIESQSAVCVCVHTLVYVVHSCTVMGVCVYMCVCVCVRV